MNLIRTEIPDLLILEPKIFGDSRGFFYESFNARVFEADTGLKVDFVQDNHSRSAQGVLRGLHYQVQQPQGKLVRVVIGEVFDVAVDLRQSSPTFKKWVGVRLSEENRRLLWIPPGFGHGFLVLSPSADFLYKTTTYYHQPSDRSLKWNDPAIGVAWPLAEIGGTPVLSEKDQKAKTLGEVDLFD